MLVLHFWAQKSNPVLSRMIFIRYRGLGQSEVTQELHQSEIAGAQNVVDKDKHVLKNFTNPKSSETGTVDNKEEEMCTLGECHIGRKYRQKLNHLRKAKLLDDRSIKNPPFG